MQNAIKQYEPKRVDSSIVDADSFKRGFYNLIDLILLDLGNDWFNVKNLVDEIHTSANWMLRYLNEDILVNLLDDLTKSEYLVMSKSYYQVHTRRYYEIGADRKTNQDNLKPFMPESMQRINNDIFNPSNTFTKIRIPTSTSSESGDHKLVLENMKGVLMLRGEIGSDNKLYSSKSMMFEEKFDIGRAPENDLQLNDPLVSRYHSRLIRSEEKWQIMDMNTANGTYVNNHRLHQNQELSAGDIISIGSIEFEYVAKDI